MGLSMTHLNQDGSEMIILLFKNSKHDKLSKKISSNDLVWGVIDYPVFGIE